MALTNIETTIILDLYDHDTTPTKIKAIALDSKTRYVLASLRDNGNVYDAGQDTTVTLTIIRPDNTGVQITGETRQIVDLAPEGEVTVYGVYAELSQAALAKKGTLRAQFMLTSGDQVLRTEIFIINCGEALDASTDTWAGEYQGYNLDELVQNVNESSAKVDAMEEDVSELKSGFSELYNSAYVTDSASGSVAHFVDGADNVPLKSLKVNIEPVQSGSGDPSPDNVRPISERDSIDVNVTGKNLIDFEWLLKKWGANYTKTEDDTFVVTTLGQGYYQPYVFAQKDVNISVSAVIINGEGASLWRLDFLNANNTLVASLNSERPSVANVMASKIRLNYSTGGSGGTYKNIQVELGSEVTEFEPYNGNTYDISLASAGTVYGGTLDVVTGILTVYPYYASYNGETLTGRWISDRDVYAVGTTPTIGAQVVNIGAVGTEYQLTPNQVNSLLGVNNIWSDAGDVEAEYRADTKLYINKRLAEVTA